MNDIKIVIACYLTVSILGLVMFLTIAIDSNTTFIQVIQ